MEKFRVIEREKPVEKIYACGIQFWPMLRTYWGLEYQSGRKPVKTINKYLVESAQSLLLGFFKVFRKYDYIVFTKAETRRKMEGYYYDRFDLLPDWISKKALFIEFAYPKSIPKKDLPQNHRIAPLFFFQAIEKIISLFIRIKLDENEKRLLKTISDELNIKMSYEMVYKKIAAQYKVFNLFSKLWKPKIVFITAPYILMGRVAAFHDAGAEVIELQHGLINNSHISYTPEKKFEERNYPDYLLTFGEYEKSIEKIGNYIDREKIIPVGHFYIDYLTKVKHEDISDHSLKRYMMTIAVTEQEIFSDIIIEFIEEAASENDNVLFVFIPRDKVNFNYKFTNENIITLNQLNTYEVIAGCDYHSTVNSTCAIESLALGTANIFINEGGKSSDYFSDLINEFSEYNFTADDPDEYTKLIKQLSAGRKMPADYQFDYYIKKNFRKNISAAVKYITGKSERNAGK